MKMKINEKYNEQGEKQKRNSIRQKEKKGITLWRKEEERTKKGTQAQSRPLVTLPNLSIPFQGPSINIHI